MKPVDQGFPAPFQAGAGAYYSMLPAAAAAAAAAPPAAAAELIAPAATAVA